MKAASLASDTPAHWGELLQGGRALMSGVLCLGIWLNAVDALVAATIMPSVAAEVGGYAYFAWATAGFMLGSIVAGAGAGLLAERLGLRRALATCGLIYAVGCAASATAGTIGPFLVGRLLQGIGAGAVVGLCYVAVRESYPERLWTNVFASLSGVWGVATLLGPLVGGVFAGAHLWRGVFWLFAVQAVAFAGAVQALPRKDPHLGVGRRGVPWLQLLALAAAVGLICLAGEMGQGLLAAGFIMAGLSLLAATWKLDAGARRRLLPLQASQLTSRATQGYGVVLSLSAAAIGFSVYGAALLQARLGLSPLQAGYVVASESVGWTVTAILVTRVPPRFQGLFIRLGAGAVAAGLAGCALTLSGGAIWMVATCATVMGGGFGLCWSFTSQRVLRALPDAEGAIGSAAIPMVQILGNAVGAAAAGVVANIMGFSKGFSAESAAGASPVLLGAFVPLALAGFAAAWVLGRDG